MQVELLEYISPDSETFAFRVSPDKWVLGIEGTGMPDKSFMTYRSPFQHGETVYDYRLGIRIIQVNFRMNACSRDDYWTNRAAIDGILRPNRYTAGNFGVGKLRFTKSNGNKRDINVVVEEGPLYGGGSRTEWDEWSINEVIRFVAHDPIFHSTTASSSSLTMTGSANHLIFNTDATGERFPWTFGNPLNSSNTITYSGTWMTYPTITLTGPMKGAIITNTSTDELIRYNATVPSGDTVTITLTPGNKTVTTNHGVNMIGSISSDSDLGTFHLAPSPEVTSGQNVITLYTENITEGVSGVTFAYYTNYVTL